MCPCLMCPCVPHHFACCWLASYHVLLLHVASICHCQLHTVTRRESVKAYAHVKSSGNLEHNDLHTAAAALTNGLAETSGQSYRGVCEQIRCSKRRTAVVGSLHVCSASQWNNDGYRRRPAAQHMVMTSRHFPGEARLTCLGPWQK
jgi:hypothetical protein